MENRAKKDDLGVSMDITTQVTSQVMWFIIIATTLTAPPSDNQP